jgi:hypothetical protein
MVCTDLGMVCEWVEEVWHNVKDTCPTLLTWDYREIMCYLSVTGTTEEAKVILIYASPQMLISRGMITE